MRIFIYLILSCYCNQCCPQKVTVSTCDPMQNEVQELESVSEDGLMHQSTVKWLEEKRQSTDSPEDKWKRTQYFDTQLKDQKLKLCLNELSNLAQRLSFIEKRCRKKRMPFFMSMFARTKKYVLKLQSTIMDLNDQLLEEQEKYSMLKRLSKQRVISKSKLVDSILRMREMRSQMHAIVNKTESKSRAIRKIVEDFEEEYSGIFLS